MKRFLFLVFVFMFMTASHDVFAGGHIVSGKVKDDNNKTLLAATISVLNAQDSSWIKTELTDDKGNFTIKDIPDGNYLLAATSLGYKNIMQPLAVKEDVKEVVIIMQRSSNELQGVAVSARRPYIESGQGKMMVNIPQASVSAGTTILDLLRKSPSITVDGNGNITMQGQGVLVMIDDRQTYLNGADLANYLKSMSADQVAQLELITQPSAKYDAEGNSGIINIKTRKDRKAGWNGNISLSGGIGVYPITFDNFNLNYKKGKVTAYANGGYLHATGFVRATNDQSAYDVITNELLSTEFQKRFAKEIFEDYNLKAGMEYAPGDKLSMGAGFKGIYHTNHEITNTNTTVTDNTGSTAYNDAVIHNGFIRKQMEDNLYAKYTPAKGHDVNVDIDYLQRDYNDYEGLVNTNYDSNNQLMPSGLQLQGHQPSTIKVCAAKLDYTGELNASTKLEAGLKSTYAWKEAGAFFNQLNNGNWVNDTALTNDFTYKEMINAAYINGSKSFGSKWQTQLGLRAEQTSATGLQTIGNQSFTRNYLNIFPTAFVSYKADSSNSFELNFGRRIDRPTYIQLNPFLDYISQYSYSSGNPLLQPEYRNYLELKHNYKNVLFTTLGVSRTSNVVNTVVNYNAANQTIGTLPENNATLITLHQACSFNKQLFKWWTISVSEDAYMQRFQLNDSSYKVSGGAVSINLNNQFVFADGWEIDTFFQCSSGGLQGISEKDLPSQYLSLNVAKKILKDSATIKLSAEDPFGAYRNAGTTAWNGVQDKFNYKFATQQFSLGFTYNFGKKQVDTRNYTSDESKRM
jgi:hypothetical protein